jgi:hypothetical protein
MSKHLIFLLIFFISIALSAQPSFKVSKQKSGFFPNLNSGLSKESDSKVSKPYEEYRTHRAGLLWMPVSNIGNFGNPFFDVNDPCTNKRLPMGEMPGSSGMNYIYNGALWCGGYLDSAEVNVKSVISKVFQGSLVSTAFFLNFEFWPIDLKNDPSGLILGRLKESSSIEGKINCLFEDVYNPKATADEQFDTYYSDKYVNYSYTGIDPDDKRPHIPLGIEVKQSSYTWTAEFAKKFIIIDYTIYNYNDQQKDIYDFFLGMYLDSDVGYLNYSEYYSFPDDYYAQLWLSEDDLCGFIDKWDNYIDPATGEKKTVDMNLAWSADNDGREFIRGDEEGEILWDAPAGTPLFGATGIAALKVLRTPNPDLKYSFNIFMPGQNHDFNIDWGPHWKTGFHSDWQYDLTQMQKGYDDTNYDSLRTWIDTPLYNGRVEGNPIQDRGRYMVMSNDEFDYNQTAIREVYLGMDTQTDGTAIPQAGKWQPWIVTGTEGAGEVADGPIFDMNNYANGMDQRFVISFGPLGYETYENVAVDSDRDGTVDDYKNKKVWKFAYGDSLKLTIAFIASENFHTSTQQSADCDYEVVDLSDGLEPSLFDQGWYDTFYNAMWVNRLYDTPLWDSPVKKWGAEKADGWFGEDVGADGIFNDILGLKCWWTDALYLREDEGEDDMKLTNFTSEVTDMYGNPATSEDNLLPFGRQHEDVSFGITGSRDTGEGYGYMVKYTKQDGVYPQGSWIRYGFDNGMLDPGDGVPDFQAPPPPYSPKIKVFYADNDVIIEWSSHEFYDENGLITVSGPEHTIDPFSRRKDFESYQVQVSPSVFAGDYTEIFSVDIDNYAYENVSATLEYLNDPVPADTIAAHPADYPAIKTVYGKIYQLMPYGDNKNMHDSYYNPGLFSYSVTADSSRIEDYGIIWNYKFVLHNQSYAEQKYIAVTSSDHGDAKSGTPSQKSSPFMNGTSIIPSKISGTDDVIVVPNPYRGDIDYENMGWENINSAHEWSESDRKIAFLNIPLRCVIRIYTLAGDLCKVITHNGNAESDVLYQYGENGAYWNLLNDNRQAVVSGIYLFSVQDVDKNKDDFVGKFVIIK